jgi:hypothetical protein
MVWAVPRLARAYGVNPSSALWLGVLNPLVVLHLAADAHNDAIMLGLMCAGLALAVERRPAAGAALITLAALVKAPAALGLVFLSRGRLCRAPPDGCGPAWPPAGSPAWWW